MIRTSDNKAALWVGAIDDLWKLGKPRGTGGPWHDSAVKANQPSDPYLLWGYDQRTLTLSHSSTAPITFTVEVDLTGEGLWIRHREFNVDPGTSASHKFPPAFQARWLRVTADHDCMTTATLNYE